MLNILLPRRCPRWEGLQTAFSQTHLFNVFQIKIPSTYHFFNPNPLRALNREISTRRNVFLMLPASETLISFEFSIFRFSVFVNLVFLTIAVVASRRRRRAASPSSSNHVFFIIVYVYSYYYFCVLFFFLSLSLYIYIYDFYIFYTVIYSS